MPTPLAPFIRFRTFQASALTLVRRDTTGKSKSTPNQKTTKTLIKSGHKQLISQDLNATIIPSHTRHEIALFCFSLKSTTGPQKQHENDRNCPFPSHLLVWIQTIVWRISCLHTNSHALATSHFFSYPITSIMDQDFKIQKFPMKKENGHSGHHASSSAWRGD